VLELADDVEAFGHGLDPRRIEGQAVEEGGGRAGSLGFRQILPIGRQDRRFGTADRLGHRGERPALLGGRRQRQRAGSLAGVAADVAHRGFELGLAVALDRLERSVHGIDPSGIQRFLPCSDRRREAACGPSLTHSYPPPSWGRQRKGGTSPTLPVFEFCKFPTRTKRVSCAYRLIAPPPPCRSVSPSAPDMSSKAAVGKTAICGCFRAMSCCRAASGSIFRPI